MYEPPPGPEGRPSRKPLIIAVAVLLVVAVTGVGGYLILRGDDDDGRQDATGPVTLREPLRFQQVVEAGKAPCAAGMLAEIDGAACYRLDPGGMTVQRVQDMRVVPPRPERGQPSWAVGLRLTSADAPRFGELSRRAHEKGPGTPGNQIAIVAGGKILSAPAIASGPITGGDLQITGNPSQFSQTYVRDLVRRMTGRTRS